MKLVPIRELASFKHGGTPSKANAAYWRGDIPWVSPKDMKRTAIADAADHISADAVAESAASIVPPGSILIVVRSGILAHSLPVAQVTQPLAFNQDIKAVLPKLGSVDADYLFWFFRAQEPRIIANGVKKGATVHSVQSGYIENLMVPLPPLPEQRRIVDLLTRADGIVHLCREAAAKAAELIPAIFVDLFGDPASNPKNWPTSTLCDLIKSGPTNGLYKHKSAYGRGMPILRIDAFYDGVVRDLSSLKRLEVDADEAQRFALHEDDIVINRVNSPEYLGKSARIPALSEPTVFESNMMRFGLDTHRVLPRYLIAYLQTSAASAHFQSKAKHAINQSSINQQDVKSLPLYEPPMKLQLEFKRRAEAVESIATQQVEALTKAQATFNALLAQAFAGKPQASVSERKSQTPSMPTEQLMSF